MDKRFAHWDKRSEKRNMKIFILNLHVMPMNIVLNFEKDCIITTNILLCTMLRVVIILFLNLTLHVQCKVYDYRISIDIHDQ